MAEEQGNTAQKGPGAEEEKLPEGVVLRDHVYDGIQEYDQRLPNWWLFTLYIAIVIFIGYWVLYYQLGWFKSDVERLNEGMAVVEAAQKKELQKVAENMDDAALWKMSKDPAVVAEGEKAFQTVCFACHGKDLSGTLSGIKLPGEPLNDAVWKYGEGKPMVIFETVMNGSPDATKGMVAFKGQLGAKGVAEVVAYVLSHHEPNADGGAIPKGK